MRIRRDPGFAAAAVLATVTLCVFGVLQNYGPESAVRRFHHAVAHNDLNEMSQVVTQGVDSSAVTQLVAIVHRALTTGSGYYRIITSDRSERQVVMLARYESTPPIVWVVVKARDGWRIDPYLTLQALRRLGY
jgi:hypothetical protein